MNTISILLNIHSQYSGAVTYIYYLKTSREVILEVSNQYLIRTKEDKIINLQQYIYIYLVINKYTIIIAASISTHIFQGFNKK